MLDGNPAAILLLDEQKRIVYANRRAEQFRSGSDGIRLSATSIVLAQKQDNDKLQQLIARVLSGMAVAGASAGLINVLRPSGRRAFRIAVARVSTRYGMLSAFRPAVCITIADPEGTSCLRTEYLAGAFGLTDAEAKLARLLANGEDLRCAANQLQITYGSARARLAQIFEKTQTRRQAELVRVLLTGIAGL
jgi:DNA-binding CsgD family transcriptional regulator